MGRIASEVLQHLEDHAFSTSHLSTMGRMAHLIMKKQDVAK
jgi:hypothetical protein